MEETGKEERMGKIKERIALLRDLDLWTGGLSNNQIERYYDKRIRPEFQIIGIELDAQWGKFKYLIVDIRDYTAYLSHLKSLPY